MIAKLLTQLNEVELDNYKKSNFYRHHVLSNYKYTDNTIFYYTEYFNNEYTNCTIIVFDEYENAVLAFYAFANTSVLSYFELPVSIIETLFSNSFQKNRAYGQLLIKLSELISQNNFKELRFYSNEYLCAAFYSKIKKVDVEYSCLIDLTIPEEIIKTSIRKSYKSLVNWGEKNLDMLLIDHKNVDYNRFVEFKNFHIQTAGRKTRSDKSWDIQFDCIKNNEAFLLLGYLSGQLVSGSLILCGATEAYYGVGVYNRQLMAEKVAVGHYNILKAIYECKNKGLNLINLGSITKNSEDEKERNIFKFKSGFSNFFKSDVINFVDIE